jgi:3-dehydroquinate synthase II
LIPGAAFALDVGVDAILLGDDEKLWQAAAICKAQRLERVDDRINRTETIEQGQLSAVMITSIEEGSTGDRACVDFVALLNQGEGILVGSSSSMMALVHGETIVSGYVPPRPFRVNAGAIHSYCMRADGKTCYLSEVSAGDELLVCNAAGETRPLTVGRVKIENRPLLLLKMKDENAHTASLCAQQAETVRLVSPSGLPVPVTELKANDYILARIDTIGRHVGAEISAKVVER